MPYKDPKKQRNHMRVYMRDYRKEEKARRKVELKKSKLALIEAFLPDKAEGTDPSELLVRPKVRKIPQEMLQRSKSVKATVNGKEVPVYDTKTIPVGFATKTEVVPDAWKKMVKRIEEACLYNRNAVVSEIWVKRQIESYINDDISELIVVKNYYRFSHLRHKIESYKELVKVGRMKAKDAFESPEIREARTMRKTIKELEEAFEQFVMAKIAVGKKSDDEILSEAKTYDATRGYFEHFLEGSARSVIKEIRGILRPTEEESESPENVDFALKCLKTESDTKLFVAAKKLVDAKRREKALGKRSKKSKTYNVEVR